jgi:hypothetical protein
MRYASDDIPVLTEVIDDGAADAAPADEATALLGELEAHLTAAIHEHADELVHNACREMEALLLEQVSDRLKAELPTLIAQIVEGYFRGNFRPH